MNETWERNSKGELIPCPGKVVITDIKLEKAIELQKFRLSQVSDENKKAVMARAVQLLEEAHKEKTRTLDILYTPLLHCELVAIQTGLGLDGIKVQDVEAEICSKHCLDPVKSYIQWRDEKDPTDKKEIATFIVEKSLPKRKTTAKEEEAFRLLQGLILVSDTGLTSSGITTSPSVN